MLDSGDANEIHAMHPILATYYAKCGGVTSYSPCRPSPQTAESRLSDEKDDNEVHRSSGI